jgi:hypothetical protein
MNGQHGDHEHRDTVDWTELARIATGETGLARDVRSEICEPNVGDRRYSGTMLDRCSRPSSVRVERAWGSRMGSAYNES